MHDTTGDFWPAGPATPGHAPEMVEAERLRIARADKRFIAAQVRTSGAGGVLHVIQDTHRQAVYIASHGCWAKEFSDLADVEAWLDRVESASCPR